MKNQFKYLFVFLLLCVVNTVFAQDVIVKKDNSTVLSKVVEVTSTEIKYKKWSNQDGPTYTLLITDVMRINYQNGETEVFSNNVNNQVNTIPQQQPITSFGGYMDADGPTLRLDGRPLSNGELRNLLDRQSYQNYLEYVNSGKTGTYLLLGGSIIGLSGVLWGALHVKNLSLETKYMIPSLIFMGTGFVSLITGSIMISSSSKKIGKIAKDYNYKNGTQRFSLGISPAVMSLEMPQFSNSYGVGLSLSMNF